jgi:hypothetical protein
VVIRVFSPSNRPGIYPDPSCVGRSLLIYVFQGLQNLLDRIERMRALGPEFVDITWYVPPRPSFHPKYRVHTTGMPEGARLI